MPYETKCRRCNGRGSWERCIQDQGWAEVTCTKCGGTGQEAPYRVSLAICDAGEEWKGTKTSYPRYGREGFCMVCDTELTGRQKVFCGRKSGTSKHSCSMLVHLNLYKGVHWQKRAIIVRDGCVCRSCGEKFESPLIEGSPILFPEPSKVALDHIVPLVDGGTEAPDNLQILCHSCHQLKTVAENLNRGRGIDHPELDLEVA